MGGRTFPALKPHRQLNTTHSLMMGGYTFDTPQSPIIASADVHMFDGEIFTQVSSKVEARAAAGCALTLWWLEGLGRGQGWEYLWTQ